MGINFPKLSHPSLYQTIRLTGNREKGPASAHHRDVQPGSTTGWSTGKISTLSDYFHPDGHQTSHSPVVSSSVL